MTAKPKTHRRTPKTKESIRYPTVPQNQTDRDKKTCAESAFVCKKVEKRLTHLKTAKPPKSLENGTGQNRLLPNKK